MHSFSVGSFLSSIGLSATGRFSSVELVSSDVALETLKLGSSRNVFIDPMIHNPDKMRRLYFLSNP